MAIDSNYELDLFVTSSAGRCVLRVMSTRRYFITLKPFLRNFNVSFRIFATYLSSRGYLIIHSKSTLAKYQRDMLEVYSINGEKVAQRVFDEQLNAVILDETQYFLVSLRSMSVG